MADKQVKLNRNGNRRGMSHNSLKNLHPRLKGNNQAKKDYSVTRILKEMAEDPAPERWLEVEDKGKGFTLRQAAARRIWIEAVRGNAKIIGELLDRVDGKLSVPIAASDEQGQTYILQFVPAKKQDDRSEED